MSILIRGMEMPMNCRQCNLYLQSMDSERNVYENCAVTAKSYNWGLTTLPSDCPLVPVPPHGRLIDADKMKESVRKQSSFLKLMGGDLAKIAETLEKGTLQEIDNAPTIIPAEEGEA